MPPKRKRAPSQDQREPVANSPLPTSSSKKQSEPEVRGGGALSDMWTDDQETCLLKAVIRWKPVGMHKHFRMTSIYDFMRDSGVINPNDKHTTIPGIWAKLGSWYNLSSLDEREDSLTFDNPDAPNMSEDWSRNFSLPDDEYREMMFERRLNPDGSQSPPVSVQDESKRGSVIADTDEPTSSPARGPNRRPLRGTRGRRRAEDDSSQQSAAGPTPEDTTMEDAEEGSAIADEDMPTRKGRTRNSRGKPAGRPRGGRRGGR